MATNIPKTAVIIVDEDGDYIGPGAGGGGDASATNQDEQTVLLTTMDADTGGILSAAQIMDDWDESDRAKVNLIVGQAGIAAGAGNVGATVPRVTLAADDATAVVLMGRAGVQYNLAQRTFTDGQQGPGEASINGIPYFGIWNFTTNQPAAIGDVVRAVSGVTASANFTPAAAAYGAADIMDVAKELAFTYANGDPVPVGSLIRILSSVMKVDVTSVPSGQTSYTGRLYSVTPPSAQADNDAWTLASGDLTVYRGPINLGTPVDEGAALYIKTQYIDTDIKLDVASSSIWMRLITDGAHTAAAVARQVLLYGVVL